MSACVRVIVIGLRRTSLVCPARTLRGVNSLRIIRAGPSVYIDWPQSSSNEPTLRAPQAFLSGISLFGF